MVKSTFLNRRKKKAAVDEVKADPVEESRDDPGLLEAFFNPSSWFPPTEESDAVSSTDDIQSIIDAHIDEETRAKCLTEKSRIGSNQDVKGSHSTLANEIKKLGKLERKKEKAEKLILRCQNEISMADEELTKTRKRIKALSRKVELHGMMHERIGPDDDDSSVDSEW